MDKNLEDHSNLSNILKMNDELDNLNMSRSLNRKLLILYAGETGKNRFFF